eukprot:CAMPEP_0115847052 /NCGR_PEP_ID=MMETSP0287-20121206/10180_1 /TAXON_ID=412157 /ORGANISM="Chrysochromulina rotalis, Strain UIO044" /LENGTH=142 /DNA_ID=CAMNT_0003300867 /DNA_START=16 /DNA_END=444 /DNA_ORIENTATION=+
MQALRSLHRPLARGLRTAPKPQSSAADSIINADSTSALISLHHKINLALLGIFPLSLVLSPSSLNMPVDLALGIFLPIHSHISMNLVITDYAKKFLGKGSVGPARYGMAALTGLTILGLTKLNLTGPGITETVKSFWRPKKA